MVPSDDSPSDALLSIESIRRLLIELDEELGATGASGELFVVGGAAMALGYGAREATRDIDALFEPKTAIADAAESVGERNGLRADWLNDAMKGFLHGNDPERRLALDLPSLQVFVASPRYLLAMKLLSARIERDADDIAMLLNLAGVTTVNEALDLVEAAYGADRILPKTALLVASLLSTDHEST